MAVALCGGAYHIFNKLYNLIPKSERERIKAEKLAEEVRQKQLTEDFVIATGVQHSVREFTYAAFKAAGIELKFEGEGLDEKGICVAGPDNLVGKTLVQVS